MKRVYVNEEWCLGCHLCEYNCAFAQSGESDMARALKGKQIYPNIHIESDGDRVSFAVNCRHCEDAPCVKNCIAGALSRKDGVVVIDHDKCVGCYTCVLSCPYGCVAPNGDGVMQKCQLCIATTEGKPRCVAGCPNNAIVFEER